MKRILCLLGMLYFALITSTFAQSNQSPTMQEATSTTDNRQANPPKPKLKKMSTRDQMKIEKGMDTTLPKNRPQPGRRQRRLPPDSLRRGGATRVDTVRR